MGVKTPTVKWVDVEMALEHDMSGTLAAAAAQLWTHVGLSRNHEKVESH